MKPKIKTIILVVALLVFPIGVFAGGKFAKNNVYVDQDQIIDGNFIAAGELVTIEGTVNGDVIVAGKSVIVSGKVAGDVIAAGGYVQVDGSVQGDVRLAGADVRVAGIVGKNASVAGGNVEFTTDSAIGWGAMVLAGELKVFGSIAKDLRGMAEGAVINGRIAEDVQLKIGQEKLVVQPRTEIGGDLIYASKELSMIMSGATIRGEVNHKGFAGKPYSGDQAKSKIAFGLLTMMFIKLIGLWILGLVLLWLHPKKIEKAIKQLNKNFWPSLGWGILVLIFAPIAAILLLFTIFGWALSFVIAGLYLAAILTGIIIVSTCFGEWLLKKITKRHWRAVSHYWAMVLGVFLFVLVTSIPILGCILKFFIISTGVGVLIYLCSKEK